MEDALNISNQIRYLVFDASRAVREYSHVGNLSDGRNIIAEMDHTGNIVGFQID